MNNAHLHPSKLMDEDLARLQALLARLWDGVDSRLEGVIERLEATQSPRDAVGRREKRDTVAEDRREIERQTLRLIALRQPVADDLRLVMATLLAAVELESVADHAASISKRLNACPLQDDEQARDDLARLARLARASLRDLRPALGHRDAGLASGIIKRDKDINSLHRALAKRFKRRMTEAPQSVEECAELLLVCKSLERAGDHVKQAASHIQALVEGPAWRRSPRLATA